MLRVIPFKQRALGIGVNWAFLRLLGIEIFFFINLFLVFL